MGRYAFFSTGFEYKFVFAVQDSTDILEFGGFRYNRDPLTVNWSAREDAAHILATLRAIETELGLQECDVDAFPKTLAGTSKLYSSFVGAEQWDNAAHARYRLGCLIYHQLSYEPALRASYEP